MLSEGATSGSISIVFSPVIHIRIGNISADLTIIVHKRVQHFIRIRYFSIIADPLSPENDRIWGSCDRRPFCVEVKLTVAEVIEVTAEREFRCFNYL